MGKERTFGEALVAARNRAGMSQTELGDKIGVRQAVLSTWERGLVPRDRDRVLDLEDALGLQRGELTWYLGWVRVGAAVPLEVAVAEDQRLSDADKRLLLDLIGRLTTS